MNVLIALVAALAAMTGWSGAEAAQARITDFAFSLRDARGPQAQAEVRRRRWGVLHRHSGAAAAVCGGGRAQDCAVSREYELRVQHQEREVRRVPADISRAGAGVRRAFPARAGEVRRRGRRSRHRDGHAGFERAPASPGGACGRGVRPGTCADGRRGVDAIQAWQRANGYAATGALTSGQAEALLGGAVPLEAFGSNWSIVENQPCQVSNYGNRELEPFTWSGACIDGKASGQGTFDLLRWLR